MSDFPFKPMLICICVIAVTGIIAVAVADIFKNSGC